MPIALVLDQCNAMYLARPQRAASNQLQSYHVRLINILIRVGLLHQSEKLVDVYAGLNKETTGGGTAIMAKKPIR